MIDRLFVLMQSMQQLSRSQEVTANNLANLNTPGFKGDNLFYHAFREEMDGEAYYKARPLQVSDLKQGVLSETGSNFDFAINGSGFFMVENEDGQKFLTRNGRFEIDREGYLRDQDGSYVQGRSGDIRIPEYYRSISDDEREPSFEVAKDGTVRVNDEIQDQIRLVGVENPMALERRSNSYFAFDSAAQIYEDNQSLVMQGYVEGSNVNALSEMTDMMKNLRLFESQQRAMLTTNDILSNVTNQLGKF